MNIKDINDIFGNAKKLVEEAKGEFLNIADETKKTQNTNHKAKNANIEEELGDLGQMNTHYEKQNRKSILVIVVILVLAFITLFFIKPFHSDNRKVDIANTTNVVSEIRKMSEFTTAAFYKELVLQDAKYKYKQHNVYQKSDNWYKRQLGMDKKVVGVETDSTEIGRIVIIAKGTIRAGFNFSRLTANDFEIRNDTLFVTMPQAEIFDVIINPSDIEFFDRRGNYWEEEDIRKIINNGKSEMYEQAMNENILGKANRYGKERLGAIFKAFGFKEVVVYIKESSTSFPSLDIGE